MLHVTGNHIHQQPPLGDMWGYPRALHLPHPLLGQPLSCRLSDADADAYADRLAPAGWCRWGSTVQGRDRQGRRVVCVTYRRVGATSLIYPVTAGIVTLRGS